MGCLFKCLDPGPPDDSVRHFWHIRGLLLDAIAPCSSNTDENVQQKQIKTTSNLCVQESGSSSGTKGGENKEADDGKGLIPKLTVQRLPPGVLYVYEGKLVYRSRRWINWSWIPNISFSSSSSNRKQPDEFAIELCQIGDVNVSEQFISQKDNKPIRCQGPLVDVLVTGLQPNLHFGFLTAQADLVGKELREVFLRHRQRPRIFQFNSVDIDGVEIEVP